MSRITIGDLYKDLRWETQNVDNKRIAETEIVPRKIVEMIIQKCHEDYKVYGEQSFVGKEAVFIGTYAKDLLRQFEEGDNE